MCVCVSVHHSISHLFLSIVFRAVQSYEMLHNHFGIYNHIKTSFFIFILFFIYPLIIGLVDHIVCLGRLVFLGGSISCVNMIFFSIDILVVKKFKFTQHSIFSKLYKKNYSKRYSVYHKISFEMNIFKMKF